VPLTPPTAATLSTFEAVSPAIARTRALLFRDFRFWRFLKLTFIAGLSQYPILNLFFAILVYGSVLIGVVVFALRSSNQLGMSTLANGVGVAALTFVVLLILSISIGFAYLFTRLRFAMIGVLATEDIEIGPAMREFGTRTWSYLGLVFVVLLILLVPLALILVPAGFHFFAAFKQIEPLLNQPQGPPPADMIPFMISLELGLYAAIFLVMIILRLAETTTRDLMMIPMALEEASTGESVGFLRGLFQVERGRTFGHILFHALLEFAGCMVAAILAYLPAVIVGLIATLIGFGLANGLWHNGPAGQVLVIAYAVTAALIFFAVLLLLMISAIGTAAVFTQSHALEYLSPRYLSLNALMHPPTIPAANNTPSLPPFPAPPHEPPPAGIF
jgi:hypothetical protein